MGKCMVLIITLLGLLASVIGLSLYFRKVKRNQTPKKPVALYTGLLLGIAIGSYGVVLASAESTIAIVLSALPLFLALFFFSVLTFFLIQKKPPLGDIKIKVGDSMLPFNVKNHSNEDFSSEQFIGKRTLFKFYRGSWCPYCSAELQMFADLQPQLDQFGVNIIAISGDTVEQAHLHVKRDALPITLLSDPTLNIVRQYGVEHHKALGADSQKVYKLFGLSVPGGFVSYRSMAIPTTILIDEQGIVRWIDQSDDYRLRASKDKVLGAVNRIFS